MYRVLVKAFDYFLAFIFNGASIKFILLAVIYYAVEFLFELLFSFLPDWFGFNNIFNGITPEMWYFLDLLALDIGAPLLIGAYGVKFLIRRLPIIG